RARAKDFTGFSEEAQGALTGYTWPGNVRELLNVIERTALLWEGTGSISAKSLQVPAGGVRGGATAPTSVNLTPTTDRDWGEAASYTDLKKRWSDAFEREYLVGTLNKHHGNVSAAARDAKLDRSNFL